ncbi:unnamed protein product [Cuscuta europaea]|uniref:Condensin complex subunit 2 n=1 Tax=Cuscuta europaea TaxID=41803 RepID=A0A9P0YJ36_CUSEU|nr:unnamed protein product [Cuscuta europaea]
MAETLSPNPKPRAAFSPPSPFFLGSNDDNFERAQARAARAAAIRRKRVSLAHTPAADPWLDQNQIFELFQNCIKLASENKINQKNTWELGLIDHLGDIIKAEEEKDDETNFQKASCTLEAGVKIYSMRVDSVHSEAYKVLGGINRVGQDNERDPVVEDAFNDREPPTGNAKKEKPKKSSTISTLESSFETLNTKKFDVAFAVDPLYHQTSAQFDEGGARGLLLNNLGVYGLCRVLFDSSEVPSKCSPNTVQSAGPEVADLSFVKDCLEEMVLNIPKKDEISPSLRHIIHQFDEDAQRLSEAYSSAQDSLDQEFDAFDHAPEVDDDDSYENYGAWAMDNDGDETIIGDQATYDVGLSESGHQEDVEPINDHDAELDNRHNQVDDYLFLSLGISSKENSWAGPDHWKFRKAKVSDIPAKADGSPQAKDKKTKSKKEKPDIEFEKSLDKDLSHIFDPPKNPKSLLLPAKREPANRLLPEDCHYQPVDLVKLFLLPNVTCLGKKTRRKTEVNQLRDEHERTMPSWDDDGECGFGGAFDDGSVCSDIEDESTLVSQPRQVNKIDIHYDKTSKQVDVQILKETLWDHIQGLVQTSPQEEMAVSFKEMLETFPDDCRATGSIQDISPHLCFICLLHLANEHGLSIQGSDNLDDLIVKRGDNKGDVQDVAN